MSNLLQDQAIGPYCVAALRQAGAQKAQCLLRKTEKHELNVENGHISLFRTTYDANVSLTGILDAQKGTVTVNNLSAAALKDAAAEAITLAQAAQPDSAQDIAEVQPPQVFHAGPTAMDLDLMYAKLARFLDYCKTTYPQTIQIETMFDFTSKHSYFQNSNGVDLTAHQGNYNFSGMFASKDGKNTSSLNGTGFAAKHLDQELYEFGSLNTLLRQSGEQLTTKMLPRKIVGDVIITPDCLGDFIEYVTGYLQDYALIAGTSVFKDKLQHAIANEKLTLRSCPVADEIAAGYFFTQDGFAAQNSTIIEHGILKTFLLSLYGSRKTQQPRAVNDGGAYIIEPGARPFAKMMQAVKKGILLCRFSGGVPSDSGDFAGVAKNSYYIEHGEIQYPLSETMIAGNLVELLQNITSISQERIDFGAAILPWMQVSGITIAGK